MTDEIIREIYENEGEEGVRAFLDFAEEFYSIWKEELDE